MTSFALAMPDECKIGDSVDSYRCYYRLYKKNIGFWKKRSSPKWFF
jgi:hypothetical protein